MASLANKYRPRYFTEVIGQDNVVNILQNQLKEGKVKQGILLTGPAGTGKTTSGRILARELNGINDAEGLRSDGIIEIDAASNNGVDNVRNIIEDCRFKSMNTPYKIYIIDEVHMLSTGAFNALLKVLEEPPEHVVFILCTTDPQKLPPTIMSRLQRFDFKRVHPDIIAKRLKQIVAYEDGEILSSGGPDGVYMDGIEDDVYDYIAKLSNGGVRDAISLLDTCIGYKSELTVEEVAEILGLVGYPVYMEFLDALVENDKVASIEFIRKIFNAGVNVKAFMKSFAEFVTEVNVFKLTDRLEYTKIPETYGDKLQDYIEEDLSRLFVELSDLSNSIKYEANFMYLIEGWVISRGQ